MTGMQPGEGWHLIADLADGAQLDDADRIARILTDAAAAAGATLLELRLHKFGAGFGVTGVALLAESHISIHTWPEYGTACVDIFMCGRTNDLDAALAAIVAGLAARVERQAIHRRVFGKTNAAAGSGGGVGA
ncbi:MULTISPECIES: adenosylmethionine decarboxylase [unclassified Sphingomonas]|uniref:adenosylmethionine decarboxylase n=1 Tax=unclassified Sphingomonas TaxID=196159 RepID=UPI00083427FF|nr:MULTISPECIES: adenosylmethionine decarboxylase [unclassified Sphingomonas]